MDYLGAIVPWLEANPRVQRYAYVFPDVSQASYSEYAYQADGTPNDIVEYYAGLAA